MQAPQSSRGFGSRVPALTRRPLPVGRLPWGQSLAGVALLALLGSACGGEQAREATDSPQAAPTVTAVRPESTAAPPSLAEAAPSSTGGSVASTTSTPTSTSLPAPPPLDASFSEAWRRGIDDYEMVVEWHSSIDPSMAESYVLQGWGDPVWTVRASVTVRDGQVVGGELVPLEGESGRSLDDFTMDAIQRELKIQEAGENGWFCRDGSNGLVECANGSMHRSVAGEWFEVLEFTEL